MAHKRNSTNKLVHNQLSLENNKTASDCLKKIKYDLCARCSHKDLHYLKKLGLTDTSKNIGLIHNFGKINQYITPASAFDPQLINNYFNDVEHGFFHGISCCILAYIMDQTITPQMWASIILHDFLKSNGFPQRTHDKKLKLFYNKLLPITYRHSSIRNNHTRSLLIKSDRLELRRYPDYEDWVDERYKLNLEDIKPSVRQLIDSYYTHVRPVLLYFYTHRDSLFLRHGYEKYNPPYTNNGSFPPQSSTWYKSSLFAIEIDTVPFTSGIGISPRVPNTMLWRDHHCSNHGGTYIWNRIKGYITLESFKSLGGVIHSIDSRDHLFAKSDIQIDNWLFVLSNTISYDKPIINFLLDNNIRVIDQSMLFDFFMIYQLLRNRLTALN